jgi:hypothetical protein
MTATEKWNKIVEYHNKHFNAAEQTVQSVWENVFAELFGYSRLEGEIERHRNVQIGSTERVITDIIIKDGDTDLFVIELKQHNLPYIKSMETQLISYLKQLRNNTGILICDKIYIFDYDYNKGDDEQDKAEIVFRQDNSDGIKFIELFSKNTYNNIAVKEFVRRHNESAKKTELIRNELTSELAADLLRDYFTDKYGVEEFEQAVKGFNIIVMPKGVTIGNSSQKMDDTQTIFHANVQANNNTSNYDRTQYRFDGQLYGKGKLVLAVVKKYISNNPNTSVDTLMQAFAHPRIKAIARLSDALEIVERTGHKRHFIKEPITLKDDKVAISTEWGIGNIGVFIDVARRLGFVIEALS